MPEPTLGEIMRVARALNIEPSELLTAAEIPRRSERPAETELSRVAKWLGVSVGDLILWARPEIDPTLSASEATMRSLVRPRLVKRRRNATDHLTELDG